jgi:hypothetical protein
MLCGKGFAMNSLRYLGIIPPTLGEGYALLAVQWYNEHDITPDGRAVLHTGRALLLDGRLAFQDFAGWPEHLVPVLDWPLDILQAAAELLPDVEEEE